MKCSTYETLHAGFQAQKHLCCSTSLVLGVTDPVETTSLCIAYRSGYTFLINMKINMPEAADVSLKTRPTAYVGFQFFSPESQTPCVPGTLGWEVRMLASDFY